ncbi:MAG: ABC transporter transmembrane domain-containing protein [Candidatus Sericytochromatia bacterium]
MNTNKKDKDIKIEKYSKLIANKINTNIDQKMLNNNINSVLRELSDSTTNNMVYPIQTILDAVGIKTFNLEIKLRDLRKITKSYYPFLLVSEKNYTFITKKGLFVFEIEDENGLKKTTLGGVAERHSINKDTIVNILMFDEAKNLDFLHSHHDSPRVKLFNLLKTEKKDLLIIFTYSLVIGLLSLVIPVAIQSLVNTIAFATLLQPLIILTLLVIFALSFESVLKLLRTYLVELLQQRIFVRVASDLSYRLPRVKIEAFDEEHAPELVNRFLDVLTIQKSTSSLLIDGLAIFVQTTVGMVLLAFYHPILLGFDLIIIACILFILMILSHNGMETSIKESKIKYKVLAWLEEISINIKSFKSYQGYIHAMQNSDYLVKDYLKARNKHFSILFRLFTGTLFLQVFASSALLGIGGWLVMEQQLTIGQLVAAELIVASIVSNFAKFGKQLEVYYDLLAAIDKISHLIDLKIEKNGLESVVNIEKPLNIEFKNVSFAYNNHLVFNKLNFDVKQSSIFAFYCEEGQGKTTISEILYGLRKPKSGIIEINNTDLQLLNLDRYREYVALVGQPEIIHGTIIDNIRMGREYIKIDDISKSLDRVNILNDMINLESGLETVLSTSGSPLSYTTSLKLMIARAIVKENSLIIFDGILDYLDDKIVKYIFENAFEKTKSTIFITTSNKKLLSYCDYVFDINSEISVK